MLRRFVLGTLSVFIGLPLLVLLVGLCLYFIADKSNGNLMSSGEERRYLIHVPNSIDPDQAVPLVISLHGGAMWPTSHRWLTQWNKVADAHGFIVVYPSGIEQPRHWRISTEEGDYQNVRLDAVFLADLIDSLSDEYNIDSSRVYLDGFSNGGGMVFVASCELPDKLAAVGIVGGAHFVSWSWCDSPKPLPLIAFHGTADVFAPWTGGPTSLYRDVDFPRVSEWIVQWSRRNRCQEASEKNQVNDTVLRITYTGCADKMAVDFYSIEGMGHQWPGGNTLGQRMLGPNTEEISATDLMWAFFSNYRNQTSSMGP